MNKERKFKDNIYDQFARIGKAIASSKRLEILDLLCNASRTVEAIAKETGMSVANASRHLQVLRTARLIHSEKMGQHVRYRLADKHVCDFYKSMMTLAENRLAEIDQFTRDYLAGKEDLEAVDEKTLLERVRNNEVIVLDVRPGEEYKAGHLSGALSIPLKEIEERLSQLPRDRDIIAYCRGPYCVLSVKAIEMLRQKGFHAMRIKESVTDFARLGFPVVGEDW